MAAAAARDVERCTRARQEVGIRQQPVGRAMDLAGAELARPGPAGHAASHVEDGHAGLCQQRRGALAAHTVLAHDEDRLLAWRQDRRRRRDQIHGKQPRATDVSELLVLSWRPHVEDERLARSNEALSLRGSDVLDTRLGHDHSVQQTDGTPG